MASSFIEYKDDGFWINDSLMEVTLTYLNKVVEQVNPREEWLEEMRQKIETCSLGYQKGFINVGLDEYLTSEDRVQKFITLIDSCAQQI